MTKEPKVAEKGPWQVRHEKGSCTTKERVFIVSDDFTHDANIFVTGDFESIECRLKYNQEIAYRLNDWKDTRHLRGKLTTAQALEAIAKDSALCLVTECGSLAIFKKADNILYLQKTGIMKSSKLEFSASLMNDFLWEPKGIKHPHSK